MYLFHSFLVYVELFVGVFYIAIFGIVQPFHSTLTEQTNVINYSLGSRLLVIASCSTMFWGYLKRGRRAGLKTRTEEARFQYSIPVISSSRSHYANRCSTRGVNMNNLIAIPKGKSECGNLHKTHFVPSVMLANTMSLVPKLDEVQELLLRLNVQIGCFVETWLKQHISDSVINIDGYKVIRKDRKSHEHGGVCIYIRNHIKFDIPENLQCCEDHELLWIKLSPTRSPRGFSCVLLGVVYYPGRSSPAESDAQTLTNHLFDSIATAEAAFPNCGIILTGDFNRLNTRPIQNHFKLKQLVKFPTRGNATLDLVLTNMVDYFAAPESHPPFGLSDHCTVFVKPKERITNQNTRKSISTRDKRDSNKACLGRYFGQIDWSCMTDKPSCEEKLKAFNDIVEIGMNNIMPEKSIRVYPKDTPWMSTKLKELIRMRQQAFHSNRHGLAFKFYRNAVNKERKLCKGKYYASKVQDLKGVNPRLWWKEVKKLCGSKSQNVNLMDVLNVPHFENLSQPEIANAINEALLEPLRSFQPLDRQSGVYPLQLEENPEFLVVSPDRVYDNLTHLNKHKAPGPDGISNWCFKEYAELLYQPITDILNTSYKEQKLPSVWKLADVTPLPKVKQVSDPKKELRPISLTASLSKIAEDFVVSDYIRPAFEKLVDPNQFGTISGSSTVFALISMVHEWLQATDGNGASVRVLLFDYRKAFDFIDHGTLASKLTKVLIPNSIVNWILDFLSDRSQRVKLSDGCRSEWGAVPSGVPQGTKLGPWLFLLMINDLKTPNSLLGMWKYVDDTTLSEVVPKNQQSNAQGAVDSVSKWSADNLFQLNLDKTKELTITFRRPPVCFDPVIVDGSPITVTTSTKLLGLTINNTLTWNDHIDNLIKKAARKLYFLIQLKRARVPPQDLVQYYCACIRSSLDYACPVFHYSLPQYLQTDLERVQKRALACIFPGLPYNQALDCAGLTSLRQHQDDITVSLFKSISDGQNGKLQHLIPKPSNSSRNYNLRHTRTYNLPAAKTKRFTNSFIYKSASRFNSIKDL